jgi:hypothetical protein
MVVTMHFFGKRERERERERQIRENFLLSLLFYERFCDEDDASHLSLSLSLEVRVLVLPLLCY